MRANWLSCLVITIARVAILHQNGRKTYQIVAHLLRPSRLKGNAQWFTLPCGRCAGRLRMVFRIPGAAGDADRVGWEQEDAAGNAVPGS